MTTVGKVEYDARINTSYLKRDTDEADSIVEKSGDRIASTGEKSFGAFGKFAKVGFAAAATAVAAGTALIVSNIDNAIKRVDTLNNSNRTFENMGFKAQQVVETMQALEKSIKGLPTPMDLAVKGVQMIAASTNDLGKSQKIFSALNNGILGFGGNTEKVSNAVVQLSQDLAGGKIQAETWNSLLDSGLGPTLAAIARQMGKTTKELKEGLSDGTVSVDTFTDALIKMDTEGGGGMASLQKIAKDSTSGIETGFSNMNTAVTRGVAEVIKAIGPEKISGAISAFGSAMESGLKNVAKNIPQAISDGNNAFQVFADWAKAISIEVNTYLKPIYTELANIIKFVGVEVLGPMIDYIKGNEQAWQVLRTALIAILVIVGAILIGFGAVVVAIAAVVVAAGALFSALINGAVWAMERVIESIGWLGDKIAGLIWWWWTLSSTVDSAMASFEKGVYKGIGLVLGLFASLPGEILKRLNNANNLLYDVGGNIIKGLIDGMKSMIGAVQSTAGNIGKSVQDKFKSVMGIHSPSKVFESYGIYTGEGYINGIIKMASKVGSAVASMVDFSPTTISPTASYSNVSDYAYRGNGISTPITQNFYPKDDLDMNVINRQLTRDLARA